MIGMQKAPGNFNTPHLQLVKSSQQKSLVHQQQQSEMMILIPTWMDPCSYLAKGSSLRANGRSQWQVLYGTRKHSGLNLG